MANTATQRAAEYDRIAPDSITDFSQKVERMERIELKRRKKAGGRGVKYFSVPELPWKKEDA